MDGPHIPRGRLRRLGKVVGLTARVGRKLVAGEAKRLLGGEDDPKVEAARRVLETLGELKGAALKLGQAISLTSDKLPPDVRKVVARLFSQAPPLQFRDISRVIHAELGASPAEVFERFEETPFAAASLGQVHAARLRTGEEVAVKVQYPGVDAALADDLRNAETVVRALGVGGPLLDGRAYLDELARELQGELDYRRELSQLEEYRGTVARWPDLVVPRSFPGLSTGKVLVLERLEGPTLHAFAQLAADLPAGERFRIGGQLVRAIYGPFLRDKVIHGDAHPGNFVVLPDGRLGVLDFGSVKHFSDRFWRCYHDAIRVGLLGERPSLLALVKAGGFTVSLPDDEAEALLGDIGAIVARPLLGPYDFGADTMIEDLAALKMSRRVTDLARIRPPAEAVLFYRAIAGLAHNLRTLRCAGDFRPLFRDLLELPPEPDGQSV